MRRKLVAVMAMTVLVLGMAAPASALRRGNQTIAEIAISNGNFTTLVAALSCTGLVPAVSGTDQLTVFAPTDAAFAALGLDADNVCSAIPQETLTTVLLFHVIEGRRNSTSVLAAPRYQTLAGIKLSRSQLAGAGIAVTDISASNGVVHVINSVLLP